MMKWLTLEVATLMALAALVPFLGNGDSDLHWARICQIGLDQNPSWPFADHPVVVFMNEVPPFLVFILVACVMGLYGKGACRRQQSWARRFASFLLLSSLLGPGIVVNVLLKQHLDRPRPRQIVEFGGDQEFYPFLWLRPGGSGHSFPSGHTAISFVFSSFSFLYRRKRPALARKIFAVALLFGLLMGACRMLSGAHYLSDVLGSLLLVYATELLLYRSVFPAGFLDAPGKESAGFAAPPSSAVPPRPKDGLLTLQ
jgi:membrane-associated PAP2 superfamily phosphatase